ncbi:MAG: hypothetical protein QM537_04800 [Candidatus Symbiobacter sp.]|nr:hypothetical protein [Candidatus Symbiobacter sp.]
MTNEELIVLGKKIYQYMQKFYIPFEYFFEILEDQKVIPMIRGKAMEYNAYLLLQKHLNKLTWDVQKLNLNAQTGFGDEDITLTHRRTGILLRVESKSAVRGSIKNAKDGKKPRPAGFNVKCHRSRSNLKLASTSNDRYSVESFDLIITNTANSIYQGGTIGDDLEIIRDEKLKSMLFQFYSTTNEKELMLKCESDWRFVIPSDIAEGGFIPRTPFVALENDKNWFTLPNLEEKLSKLVNQKWDSKNKNSPQTSRRA